MLISKQKSAVAFADSALVRRGLAEKFRPAEEQQKKQHLNTTPLLIHHSSTVLLFHNGSLRAGVQAFAPMPTKLVYQRSSRPAVAVDTGLPIDLVG